MASEFAQALDDLSRLQEEHRHFTARLDRLLHQPYLTEEGRAEEIRFEEPQAPGQKRNSPLEG